MASQARTIEISDIGDLGALVEEVRRSRSPRILRRDGEDVAVLTPLTRTAKPSDGQVGRPRAPTKREVADSRAAIQSAAGSWQDIDVEKLKDELRRQRAMATRPSVDL